MIRHSAVALGGALLVAALTMAAQPADRPSTSLAERIARLQRAIEADETHLQTLQGQLQEHEREFQQAGDEFKQVDADLDDRKKACEAARNAGEAEKADELDAAIADLQKKWQLARERFDLAIGAQKTAQEQIAGLRTKIEQDRQALQKLIDPPAPVPAATGESSTPPSQSPVPTPPRAVEAAASLAPVLPGAPAPQSAPAADEPASPTPADSTPAQPKPSEEVVRAQEEAAKAESVAEQAEQEVEEIRQRLEALEKNIVLEQDARDAARKQGDNAEETLQALGGELQKAMEDNASSDTIQTIRRKMFEAQQRLRDARAEVRRRATQLDKLQAERATLLSEQLAAAHQLEEEREKADAARKNLEAIRNPFSTPNVLRWLADKGPKLLTILLVTLGLHVLIKVVAQRIVVLITRNEDAARKERENRANTLVGVFHNTSIVIVYVGAGLMALEVAGIPIAPLLGGAAVAGLAIAFAAQNLIKDYFYGFMILLEDQYGVNDVVTIGGITGYVERITLRITVLRDFDAVHFVPHGQITSVSNLTHKWSRAVLEIGISYREDVDQVMDVLVDLAKQMRLDPELGRFILDDPEMLGVDAFGDSAVIIKFLIKTQPMRQWTVKRELLRRIKNRFDELGIEIPFPHRTVYHRYEGDAGVGESLRRESRLEC